MSILHHSKGASLKPHHMKPGAAAIKSTPVKVAVGSGSRPVKSKHKIHTSGESTVRESRHVPGALK